MILQKSFGAFSATLLALASILVSCATEESGQTRNIPQTGNTPNPLPLAFSTVDAPRRLTTAEIATLLSANGVTNSTGKYVFVVGRIQAHGVKQTCWAANLYIKWSSSSPWIRLNSFFLQGTGVTTGAGNGWSGSTQFFLPPGGAMRLADDDHQNCNSGSTYLGGSVGSEAPAGFDEAHVHDWTIFPLSQ